MDHKVGWPFCPKKYSICNKASPSWRRYHYNWFNRLNLYRQYVKKYCATKHDTKQIQHVIWFKIPSRYYGTLKTNAFSLFHRLKLMISLPWIPRRKNSAWLNPGDFRSGPDSSHPSQRLSWVRRGGLGSKRQEWSSHSGWWPSPIKAV